MIDKNRAQIPIIKDQASEAIRRIELNIEALLEQIDTASKFLAEDARAANKKIAYDLSLLGVDVIERVNSAPDQMALTEDLRRLLKETKESSIKPQVKDDDLGSFFTT